MDWFVVWITVPFFIAGVAFGWRALALPPVIWIGALLLNDLGVIGDSETSEGDAPYIAAAFSVFGIACAAGGSALRTAWIVLRRRTSASS